MIQGRRRIGKGTLVEAFAKRTPRYKFYQFSGLEPKPSLTPQQQIDEFVRQMVEQFSLPNLQLNDWGDAFTLLSSQIQQQAAILLFDEISWMGGLDETFLPKLMPPLQNLWVHGGSGSLPS